MGLHVFYRVGPVVHPLPAARPCAGERLRGAVRPEVGFECVLAPERSPAFLVLAVEQGPLSDCFLVQVDNFLQVFLHIRHPF